MIKFVSDLQWGTCLQGPKVASGAAVTVCHALTDYNIIRISLPRVEPRPAPNCPRWLRCNRRCSARAPGPCAASLRFSNASAATGPVGHGSRGNSAACSISKWSFVKFLSFNFVTRLSLGRGSVNVSDSHWHTMTLGLPLVVISNQRHGGSPLCGGGPQALTQCMAAMDCCQFHLKKFALLSSFLLCRDSAWAPVAPVPDVPVDQNQVRSCHTLPAQWTSSGPQTETDEPNQAGTAVDDVPMEQPNDDEEPRDNTGPLRWPRASAGESSSPDQD